MTLTVGLTSVASRIEPLHLSIPCLPVRNRNDWPPRAMTRFGLISSMSCLSCTRPSTSSGRGFGFRNQLKSLPGGRVWQTFVMKHEDRCRPTRSGIRLSSSPDPPENGVPVCSSVPPGASPTRTIFASRGPCWIRRKVIWIIAASVYGEERLDRASNVVDLEGEHPQLFCRRSRSKVRRGSVASADTPQHDAECDLLWRPSTVVHFESNLSFPVTEHESPSSSTVRSLCSSSIQQQQVC